MVRASGRSWSTILRALRLSECSSALLGLFAEQFLVRTDSLILSRPTSPIPERPDTHWRTRSVLGPRRSPTATALKGRLAAVGTPEVVRWLGGAPWTREDGQGGHQPLPGHRGLTGPSQLGRPTHRTCGYARTNVAWLTYDLVSRSAGHWGDPGGGLGLATQAAVAVLPRGRDRSVTGESSPSALSTTLPAGA